MVVKCVRINESTYEYIDGVSNLGRGWDGAWHTVQSDGSRRVMKHKYTSTLPREWSHGLLHEFTKTLTTSVIDKINPNEQYMIGKLNLLKNDGFITRD